MTPEEKAREIASKIVREASPAGLCDVCVDDITAALRTARLEALEEAAIVAVQNARDAFLSGSSDGQTVAFAIATAIRQLKDKGS